MWKFTTCKIGQMIELEAQWPELVSLTFHSALRKLNTEPSICASHQVSVHLAKQFQRRIFFLNRPIRNKNCLWWPCMLTDQDEMRTFHRCFLPSFGLFGELVSEEKIFRNRPIRNKNCLWWPCLLTNRDEMSSFSSFGHAVSEEKIF
jgi:Zn-finger protein